MKRTFTRNIAPLLLIAPLAFGCATIVSKSSNPVIIRSNPAGANIVITDKMGHQIFKGVTPNIVKLKAGAGFFSKAAYFVKISSPGFVEKTVKVDYKLNGWYFGNIVFGGALGLLVIDPISGAMWKIKDTVVDETLEKGTSVTNVSTLKILDIRQLSKEEKANLVKLN